MGGSDGLKDEGSRSQAVIAGATAGLVARFVIAPLDVAKIRLQLQSISRSGPAALHQPGAPVYRSTIQTFQHILANEGITGLWKGNVPAEVLYVCFSAVQFSAYRSTAQLLHRTLGEKTLPKSAESFICGAVAGAVATTATYPLDLLRTRFAAQGSDRVYASLRRAIVDIARDEGPRGFFRGILPTLSQIVPNMAIFFSAYETLRLPLSSLSLPWGGGSAIAGVIASVTAKTVVFPLDLVRKRMQVQGPTRSKYVHKNIPEYSGALAAIRTIVATEGFRGLYRGLPVSLIKAAPSSAVTIWTYETTMRFLKRLEDGKEKSA